MKEVKILLLDIKDNYGKQTGDLGAREFIKKELTKGEFDLNKPYKKTILEDYLIFQQ